MYDRVGGDFSPYFRVFCYRLGDFKLVNFLFMIILFLVLLDDNFGSI